MDIRDRTNDFFRQSSENGLELREGQAEMADEVSKAIEDHVPLAVEAEVGTGKSYAYLIPAVIKFSGDNQQTAIATSTIALQEQLYKDARNVLKMLKVNVDIIVAKGMRNYVCKHRLRVLLKENKENTLLQKIWKAVIDGNQDRIDLRINIPPELWGMICIRNYGNEYCHICDHTTSCQYNQIRKKIKSGRNIVICNQNMLISHYLHEKGIFNQNCSTFIIDEAHDIEGKFREAYTESYSRTDMIRIINRCAENTPYQERKLSDTLAGGIGITIQKLYEELVKQVHQRKKEFDEESKAYYFDMTKAVAGYVSELHRKFQRFERFTHVNTSEIQEFLYNILYPAEHIIWIEDGNEIRLCICPKDIRRKISLLLFAKGNVILTSATISDKHIGTPYERCGYYLDSIGFPSFGRVSEPKKSPFDYDKNTMLYCSAALPYPRKKEEYRKASIAEIIKLLEVTNGKTLILFTSKTDMDYVYKRLSNMHLQYKILIQHSSSSQEYVLEKFRKDVNSVILGTGTFWEGINIEGESLSQVIIYKLPFPVPNPIIDYKMSIADDPINDVAVPEMIIKLKQGTGRLIRSASDKGIVSILDPRVSSKIRARYRSIALNSLPIKSITENIGKIRDFWNNLMEGTK